MKKRILIVEDEIITAKEMKVKLESLGLLMQYDYVTSKLQYDYVIPCLNQVEEEVSQEEKEVLHGRGGDVYNGRDNTLRGYTGFIGKEDEKYRSSIGFGFVDTAGTTDKEAGSAAGS